MSEEIGQEDSIANNGEVKVKSATSAHGDDSPVHFTDHGNGDNVQTSTVSENEGQPAKTQVSTEDSKEEKYPDMDEDGNQDYLVNQFEFTEEMLPDTQTQLNDDLMLPEDHSLTTEEILGLHPNEDHGDNNITEINQQSPPFGDSLLLEAPSGEGDGPNQLKYEAQDRESPSDEHGRPANRESFSDERGRPANRESFSDEHGRPATRESPSDEHGRPANRESPSDEHGRPANRESPSDEHGRPATRESPSDEHGRPANRESFSDEHGRPATRESPSDEHGRPAKRESPSDEHGRPANRESPSDEHGRPANRESPTDEHGRPANRESPSDEHGRPANRESPSDEHGRPANRESFSDEHGRPATRESPSDEHGRPAKRESPSDEHGRPAKRESPSDEHGRPASAYTTSYEEYALLLEQLTEEQAHAIEHGKKLHTILAPVFAKKPKEEMERILQGEMQAESYEESLEILIELKRNMMEEREMAERLAEELRMQAQERLSKVDKEWRELLSLKKDVALMVLSRRTAKLDALAKVESALASEEMHQDELTRLRLQNFGLANRIRRLELELREADRTPPTPTNASTKLHTRRMERKKHREKRHEEAIRVQRRVMRSSEVLSNIKQKLHSTETQVQHQQEKLAQVNVILAQHRDKLTNIKRARSSQQRDNTRLKEQHGLLGNEVLLRDYDYTKQANAALEEKLQDLKCQQADLEFYLNRRKITFQTM